MTASGLGNSAFPPSATFSLSFAQSQLPLGLVWPRPRVFPSASYSLGTRLFLPSFIWPRLPRMASAPPLGLVWPRHSTFCRAPFGSLQPRLPVLGCHLGLIRPRSQLSHGLGTDLPSAFSYGLGLGTRLPPRPCTASASAPSSPRPRLFPLASYGFDLHLLLLQASPRLLLLSPASSRGTLHESHEHGHESNTHRTHRPLLLLSPWEGQLSAWRCQHCGPPLLYSHERAWHQANKSQLRLVWRQEAGMDPDKKPQLHASRLCSQPPELPSAMQTAEPTSAMQATCMGPNHACPKLSLGMQAPGSPLGFVRSRTSFPSAIMNNARPPQPRPRP